MRLKLRILKIIKYHQKMIYYKNENKIITEDYTEAKIKSEYNIISGDTKFLIDKNELSSNDKSTIRTVITKFITLMSLFIM